MNRRKIDSTIDNLLAASKSGNKAQVVEAAKALTEVVKEVESKELDDDTSLKQDTRALLEQAKLALDGTDNQLALEASASKMKKEVEEDRIIIILLTLFFVNRLRMLLKKSSKSRANLFTEPFLLQFSPWQLCSRQMKPVKPSPKKLLEEV